MVDTKGDLAESCLQKQGTQNAVRCVPSGLRATQDSVESTSETIRGALPSVAKQAYPVEEISVRTWRFAARGPIQVARPEFRRQISDRNNSMALKLPPEVDIKRIPGTQGDYGLVDVRYFPLTIEKKIGDNPSEEYIHSFYKWRRDCSLYAESIGTKHINIMEFDDWGVPKPTIRKLIGEYSAKDATEPGFLWQYLVVKKPVMRGAITAIVWMRGDSSRYTFVPSYKIALEKAKDHFMSVDIQPPAIDPSTYDGPGS